jgi:hypothetical protein
MPDTDTRLFRVHAHHRDAAHAHVVAEASFEAAAAAWLEIWPGEISADLVVSVVVRDLADGCEHCFHLDLETGAAAPCD